MLPMLCACHLLSMLCWTLLPSRCLPLASMAHTTQAHLLLGGTSAHTAPAGPCASLAPLSTKAADGFLSQPAVLQAAMLQCGSASPGVPTAASSVCLPTAATAVAAAAWSASGAAAALVADGSASLAAALRDVQYREARQLEPSLAAASQAAEVADTLYEVEWQAADSLASLGGLAAPQAALAAGRVGGRRPMAALALSQAASLAAAGAVQVLHSHVRAPIKALTLHAADSVPAQPALVGAAPAVGAAAVSGVMKNLPYEMPFITGAALETEAVAVGAGALGPRAFAVSGAALPAALQSDLYGVAARRGALHRPLLTYVSPPGGGSSDGGQLAAVKLGAAAGTCVITGGVGGLGLMTASLMAAGGVPALVLLSRSGVAGSAGDGATIARLPGLVCMAKCDVSFSEDARLLAATARAQAGVFTGVVHAAGLQVRLQKWLGGGRDEASVTDGSANHLPYLHVITAAGPGAAAAAEPAHHAPGHRTQAGRGAKLRGGGARRPAGRLPALLLGLRHHRQRRPRQLRGRQRGAGRVCRAAGRHRRARRGGAVGRLGLRG